MCIAWMLWFWGVSCDGTPVGNNGSAEEKAKVGITSLSHLTMQQC